MGADRGLKAASGDGRPRCCIRLINVHRHAVARPGLLTSGHRCNGDEPTQGFSDSVCVVPRTATKAAHTVAGAEAQALHVLRPEQHAAAHAPPPADIANDTRRLVVSIEHGFSPCAVILRPALWFDESKIVRLHGRLGWRWALRLGLTSRRGLGCCTLPLPPC